MIHHILTERGVDLGAQHCVMLYGGYERQLLLWLDSQYHTPGYHVNYPELGGILTRTGMQEIKKSCEISNSGVKTRVYR